MRYNNKQSTLLGEGDTEQEYRELISEQYTFPEAITLLDGIDWDFKDFITQYLTHRFHSYPARFIPQIPLTLIKLFTDEGDTVLDPFCGCGTTVVEAFLNDRNSIGNDFNPLAVLITKVKTTLIDETEFGYLNRKLSVMARYPDLNHGCVEAMSENLPNRKISKIFNMAIISKLEAIRETLLEVKEEGHDDVYDLGRTALSSTIRALVETGNGTDVGDMFLRKVKNMRERLKETDKIVTNIPDVQAIDGDARRLEVETDSVDLIVTSPPYVNALDYYRVHMYNMIWLGMDFDLFRKHEVGGHSHFIANRFRLLSEYLGDMLRSMIEMNRVLKSEGLCAIVVGNSSLEYELIESHRFFAEMAEDIGFEPVKIVHRNIDKTKKYTSADVGKIDDEYILVMQKTDDAGITAGDNGFVSEIVTEQMVNFSEQIKKVQGTSIRGRRPTKERLLNNIGRIGDAIETIPQDVKIKT